ncbi:MAG: hypothetical protein JJT94_17660 [Bernardetiaceae bacterium]|nr:hypothetical protein [Bernardetiaceae bacterium]
MNEVNVSDIETNDYLVNVGKVISVDKTKNKVFITCKGTNLNDSIKITICYSVHAEVIVVKQLFDNFM